MKKTKTQSGITLVALIITIIVLLILAIVSIRTIQQGGIIGKAQTSTEKYSASEEEEKIKLAVMETLMDAYPRDNGKMQADKLKMALTKQFPNDEIESVMIGVKGMEGTPYFKNAYIQMRSGRWYRCGADGSVVRVGGVTEDEPLEELVDLKR